MTYDTIDNDVTIAGGAEGALGRIDKYELVRELGEGGFGTVYLARDTVVDVDVAVKGLPPEVKHNESELESIRGNFALVKRLRHPNIVAVTDLHQALSVSYASKDVESKLRVFERDTMVVMDYAPGVTLAQWRRQFPGGKVPLDKAIAVVRQIASALDYAHAQKVLHRDVKPANVMVETSDGGKLVARVLDFGLAAEIRSSMGRLSREIRDTSGTRPYMAPEQLKGERQGAATDQYALAAMFYELVVGDVPFSSVFDCGDPAVMSVAVTTNAPTIPEDLPKCVRKALAVALAKKPEERFTTCGEFAAALEGKKVSRGGAETQRKSGVGIALAALALVAAIGVGGWIYHQNQESRRAGHIFEEMEKLYDRYGYHVVTNNLSAEISIDKQNLVIHEPFLIKAKIKLPKVVSTSVHVVSTSVHNVSLWLEPRDNAWKGSFVGAVTNDTSEATFREIVCSYKVIFKEPYKGVVNFSAKVSGYMQGLTFTQKVSASPVQIDVTDSTSDQFSALNLHGKGNCAVEDMELFIEYVVQCGDYMAKISKRFNVPISKIKLLNNMKDETLRVGQVLKLPGKIDVGAQNITEHDAIGDKPNGIKTYTPYTGPTKDYVVKSGDTLGAIAYGNGINIRQLKELNNMEQDVMRVGQILKVPARNQ